jgi:hypothetical protein
VSAPELFPVNCPTCGARLDHDGIGRCSLVIARLRARLDELTAEQLSFDDVPTLQSDGVV